MSEPSFASLGPTLLARKGGAKPAMRPQVAPLTPSVLEPAAIADDQLEDLGWNDMGDSEADSGAEIVPITSRVPAATPIVSRGPVVRRQQRQLAERVLAEAVLTDAGEDADEPDSADQPAARTSRTQTMTVASARRAAFTLRLDTDRHLKLRLAATMHGVSAQSLLTDALDAMLAEFNDLDVIANHLKRN
jgi:hypothetical protein